MVQALAPSRKSIRKDVASRPKNFFLVLGISMQVFTRFEPSHDLASGLPSFKLHCLRHRRLHVDVQRSRIMSSSTDTALLIVFGIISFLAAVAGMHYRDSLCCLFCRSLFQAWFTRMPTTSNHYLIIPLINYSDGEPDTEAMAGAHPNEQFREQAVVELQPMLSLPIFVDRGGPSSQDPPCNQVDGITEARC